MRRKRESSNDYLSRPRLIGISEFGPHNLIYHEGAKYEVERAVLPIDARTADGRELELRSAKVCKRCGRLHEISEGPGPDCCLRCEATELDRFDNLLHLTSVITRRRERISSDEEERRRQGYHQQLAYDLDPSRAVRARVLTEEGEFAQLEYGQSTSLWLMNLGWERSIKSGKPPGFKLDPTTGRWSDREKERESDDPEESSDEEPPEESSVRVVPFVNVTANCLLLDVSPDYRHRKGATPSWLISLMEALKVAVQAEFQLEERELAAEILAQKDATKNSVRLEAPMLFYEAAEGGAGVLNRLVEEESALARVARRALSICHFDEYGQDTEGACEVACYRCLLSYQNQTHHLLLDRRKVKETLLELAKCRTELSGRDSTRQEWYERLRRLVRSELERDFLDYLYRGGYRLPDSTNELIEEAQCRPDFYYRDSLTAVFLDGQVHDGARQHERDSATDDRLMILGYTVLRLRYNDWRDQIGKHPDIFGKGQQ